MGRFDRNEVVPQNEQAQNTLALGNVGNMGMLSPIMTPSLMREMATIYSQMAMAQARPRDYADVQRKLKNICARESLAAASTYAYAKGGTDITGPSIRLAEAIASVYGNFKYGYEVTERTPGNGKVPGNSKIRAYAFDMETNTQAERIFDVPHWRDTKSGGYAITDAREIYELEANMSARRKRACILEILPRDIVEFAIAECEVTTSTKLNLTPERISKMVSAFSDFGVSKEAIEDFIQRTVESIHKSQFLRLMNIYQSLKDGIAKPSDFFDLDAKRTEPTPKAEPKKEEPKKETPKTDEGLQFDDFGDPDPSEFFSQEDIK